MVLAKPLKLRSRVSHRPRTTGTPVSWESPPPRTDPRVSKHRPGGPERQVDLVPHPGLAAPEAPPAPPAPAPRVPRQPDPRLRRLSAPLEPERPPDRRHVEHRVIVVLLLLVMAPMLLRRVALLVARRVLPSHAAGRTGVASKPPLRPRRVSGAPALGAPRQEYVPLVRV